MYIRWWGREYFPGGSVLNTPPAGNPGSIHGTLQARILEWGAVPFSRGSNPGLPPCRRSLYQLSRQGGPRILECIASAFSRGIFLTQELNRGLLPCRQILYQLSYQGSPYPGLIPGSQRFSGEGNDNPLQYSCLENPRDKGAP